MRFIFTLSLFVFLQTLSTAQVLYKQDFEDGFGDMILIDQDKRPPHPNVGSLVDAWNLRAANDDLGISALSTSWTQPVGRADDWMITPVISGFGPKTFLLWKAFAIDANFRDGYEVRVSENGGAEIADFTKVIFSVNAENAAVTDRSVNMSEFEGKNIRIAFRNNSNDMFILAIDDIQVVNLKDVDMLVEGMTTTKYYPVGSESTVQFVVSNTGLNPVTSFTYEWSNGEDTYSETVNGVNLAFGQQYIGNLKFNAAEVKTYNVTLEITGVNGASDETLDNNFGYASVYGLSKPITRKMVAEEGTGTWCVWCPRGSVFMKKMRDDFPNEFIGIAVHNNDPMAFDEYDDPFGDYISGYPSVAVNRVYEVDPQDLPEFYTTTVSKEFSPIEMSATQSITNNVLNVSGNVTFYGNIEEAQFNVVSVVLEDFVKGSGPAWAQANAYAGGGQGVMGGYENLPNPVPASQMVYQEVARALPFGFSGNAETIPAELTNEQSVAFNFSYEIPTTSIAKNMYAAVFVTDDQGVIVGGTKTDALYTNVEDIKVLENLSVFPNPTDDAAFVRMNLNADAQVQISLVNVLGQVISTRQYGNVSGDQIFPVLTDGLNTGMYNIQIQINNQMINRKLMVK
jgi:hypothetical protein